MFQAVTNLLVSHSLLFIGYSLSDPDVRQIWRLVDTYLAELRRPSYVLLVDPSADEVSTYERRRVTRVISLPGARASYGTILTLVFEQILNEIEVAGSHNVVRSY
jgi:hypothetical protein